MKPCLLLLFFLFIFVDPSFQFQVSISLNSTNLSKSGDSVLIKWFGVDLPSDLDWLGIYSPPDSPNDQFIGYVFLSKSPTWKAGLGSVSLPLVNLRSSYSFRIFRWTRSEVDPTHLDEDHNPLPGTAHLLASSEVVSFQSGRGPEQIHLSFTDNDDEMRVVYITKDARETYVRYGEKERKLDSVALARVRRYEREHMCDAPANRSIGWRDPGYIHDGVMTNLKKGVRYYYKVGNDYGGWSETHSFVSRNGDSDETIAFLFGDMGTATPYNTFLRTQEESISTMKWILRDIEALGDKPAFISHIGDISYARGYSWLWDHFFTQIEPVAARVAYHVCIGNHEYDWPLQPWKPDWASYGRDGGGECGVPYSLKFNMPGNSKEPTGTEAPATRNLYYSFDMGAVHFVYFSTETNFLPGSSQYNFLKHDLESVDRGKTPFVIVQGHRPMYTTSNEFRDAGLRAKMLEHLEPLLVKNNVTLALWGHVHRYERFCPLNNFTCSNSVGRKGEDSEAYTVHIVIGMAGQDWQPIWEPRPDHPKDPIYPQPERSLYRGGEFGYTRLFATKEKLVLSYVGNHDGEVHDMVEILASGEVINGGAKDRTLEWTFSWYVKAGSVLILGTLLGYLLGWLSHGKKNSEARGNWTPVKTEEP
ncbi:probable inactive purple acid phosphatase 2 [Neltuma alba]|uniref:probable inactive purple acid phosphatase 2 n=1 Tax=Neltuma alba TaxID=207710 RepID=UPI0010A4C337|nr:probable inactive purple acid phosphatase 2 [Prosopis alba]XP_028803646.1 probable inactive purple acid phosphatase 2 [Prosopis alba]